MRLGHANLDRIPSAIRRPAYDRSRVTPGIVHLGLGAFHRAHQAVVIDDCLAAGSSSWGIIGASLRSPETRDALAPQDHLYTVAVRATEGTELRVIGALLDSVVGREKPAALVERMADPAIRIVSLTVTEKGYCHTPQTGDLDERHPDVVHDLNNLDAPRSAPGFIVAALARRRALGVQPFTVLCCDNLAANGHTVQRIVTQFAALRSKDLGKWIADKATFPSTMVDRIVPQTTDTDRDAVASSLGLRDAWPVMTEPFTQWVVEDRFVTGRPDLAAAGVELVSDVKPFELMKLRLLNASHSALAYLGYLAGHETVAAASSDPVFARFLQGLWGEIIPTVPAPQGVDLKTYAGDLLARFQNPAIRHRTWQIAMDGSQKLPQRLLGAMQDRLAKNLPIATHALAVAGWMRYVTATDEQGRAIDVRDPLAAELAALAREAGPAAERLAPALLGVGKVFGPLGAEPRLREAVTVALGRLYKEGARRAVETLISA